MDRLQYFDLDVQLDQRGQAVDGFAEVDGLGIEVDLLHLGIGTHHGGELQRNGCSASNDQRAVGRWGLWSAYDIPLMGSERLSARFSGRRTMINKRCCAAEI